MTRPYVVAWVLGGLAIAGAGRAERLLAARAPLVSRSVTAAEDVTVRGCVEQDAASSAASYKLIAAAPSKTPIYRLIAPKDIDLAKQVGHTVDVTGTVGAPRNSSRPEPDLTIKTLTLVKDSCSTGTSRSGSPR